MRVQAKLINLTEMGVIDMWKNVYQRLVDLLNNLIKVRWKLFVEFGWKYWFIIDSPMRVCHNKICIMRGSQFQSFALIVLPKIQSKNYNIDMLEFGQNHCKGGIRGLEWWVKVEGTYLFSGPIISGQPLLVQNSEIVP